MAVCRHLDDALRSLVRARETAELFHHSTETIERLDLVKRAVVKIKSQIGEQRNGPTA